MKHEPQAPLSFAELARRAGAVPASSLAAAAGQSPTEPSSEGEGSLRLPRLSGFIECACAGESVGGSSLLEFLLRRNATDGAYAAVVDLAGAFDPDGLPPGLGQALLWVRCRSLRQALACLDLLLRDENFSLVAADLRATGPGIRMSVPPTQWYRLQRLAHRRPGGLLVLSRGRLTPCADRRFTLEAPPTAAALDRTRSDHLGRIAASLATQLPSSTPVPAATAG